MIIEKKTSKKKLNLFNNKFKKYRKFKLFNRKFAFEKHRRFKLLKNKFKTKKKFKSYSEFKEYLEYKRLLKEMQFKPKTTKYLYLNKKIKQGIFLKKPLFSEIKFPISLNLTLINEYIKKY